MTTPATDHRRATAERNVEAILDAAERLLSRRTAVSIAAVAAESGVSRVTVYAHFASLEELIEAVVERATGRASAAFDAIDTTSKRPLAALDQTIAVGWGELARQDGLARAASQYLAPDRMRRSHESMLARFRQLVDRGRDEGDFRTDLPADWLVTSVFALIHAAADDVRADRMSADEALAALATTVRDVFVGRAR